MLIISGLCKLHLWLDWFLPGGVEYSMTTFYTIKKLDIKRHLSYQKNITKIYHWKDEKLSFYISLQKKVYLRIVIAMVKVMIIIFYGPAGTTYIRMLYVKIGLYYFSFLFQFVKYSYRDEDKYPFYVWIVIWNGMFSMYKLYADICNKWLLFFTEGNRTFTNWQYKMIYELELNKLNILKKENHAVENSWNYSWCWSLFYLNVTCE